MYYNTIPHGTALASMSAIMSQTELSMPDLKKSNRDQDTFTEMQEDRKTKDTPESTHV